MIINVVNIVDIGNFYNTQYNNLLYTNLQLDTVKPIKNICGPEQHVVLLSKSLVKTPVYVSMGQRFDF